MHIITAITTTNRTCWLNYTSSSRASMSTGQTNSFRFKRLLPMLRPYPRLGRTEQSKDTQSRTVTELAIDEAGTTVTTRPEQRSRVQSGRYTLWSTIFNHLGPQLRPEKVAGVTLGGLSLPEDVVGSKGCFKYKARCALNLLDTQAPRAT